MSRRSRLPRLSHRGRCQPRAWEIDLWVVQTRLSDTDQRCDLGEKAMHTRKCAMVPKSCRPSVSLMAAWTWKWMAPRALVPLVAWRCSARGRPDDRPMPVLGGNHRPAREPGIESRPLFRQEHPTHFCDEGGLMHPRFDDQLPQRCLWQQQYARFLQTIWHLGLHLPATAQQPRTVAKLAV